MNCCRVFILLFLSKIGYLCGRWVNTLAWHLTYVFVYKRESRAGSQQTGA